MFKNGHVTALLQKGNHKFKKIINLLGSKMGKIGYALVKRKNIFDFLLRALKKSPDVHIVPASKTSLIFWPIVG